MAHNSQKTALTINDTGAPFDTTDRLYQDAGDLYFDGTLLTGGGGSLPASTTAGAFLIASTPPNWVEETDIIFSNPSLPTITTTAGLIIEGGLLTSKTSGDNTIGTYFNVLSSGISQAFDDGAGNVLYSQDAWEVDFGSGNLSSRTFLVESQDPTDLGRVSLDINTNPTVSLFDLTSISGTGLSFRESRFQCNTSSSAINIQLTSTGGGTGSGVNGCDIAFSDSELFLSNNEDVAYNKRTSLLLGDSSEIRLRYQDALIGNDVQLFTSPTTIGIYADAPGIGAACIVSNTGNVTIDGELVLDYQLASGATYNIPAGKCIVEIDSATTTAVNIPASLLDGKMYILKKIGSVSVTITPAGGDTIDGSATYSLTGTNTSITIYYNSTANDWRII